MTDARSDHDILVGLDTKFEVLIEQGKDHETRIRGLEKSKYRALGIVSVLSFITAFLGLRFGR